MASPKRRLFVNWYTKRLQVSDRNGAEFVLPAFTKYETIPFEIVIVQPDFSAVGVDKYSRLDISSLSLVVALNDTLDDQNPLCYQPTWTKDEEQNIFSGELALNTVPFNNYIGTNATMPAYFEIEISETNTRSKIYSAPVTLALAVAQTGASVPTPVDEYLTKAQIFAQFLPKVMAPGEQITITSPGNVKQRILGISDTEERIDEVVDV